MNQGTVSLGATGSGCILYFTNFERKEQARFMVSVFRPESWLASRSDEVVTWQASGQWTVFVIHLFKTCQIKKARRSEP